MVKRTDFIDAEDIEKMFQAAATEDERIFLRALYFTGARISELVGNDTEEDPDPLTPKMVFESKNLMLLRNLKSKRVKVNCASCGNLMKAKQFTCQCGKQDFIRKLRPKRWKEPQIPEFFMKELMQYIEDKKIPNSKPIFPFSRYAGYRTFRRVAEKAGIALVGERFPHPHNLRHSFVAQGLKTNADLKFLQQQTGHASISTLGEYMAVLQDRTEQVSNMFSEFDTDVNEPVPEINQPVNEPVPEINQPVNEPVHEINQPVNEPVHEINQPVNEPVPEITETLMLPLENIPDTTKSVEPEPLIVKKVIGDDIL